jgi:hypothetical protein
MLFNRVCGALAFVALAACQITIEEPVVQPGTPTARPSTAEMRSACTRAAQAQRMTVLQFGDFQTVTGSRGIEIGASSLMRVSRDGFLEDARCSYSFGDRQARITPVDAGAGSEPARPSPGQIRTACVRAAQGQGLTVLQVGEFETVTGSRGIEIGSTAVLTVARGLQFQSLRCSYSFGDGEVRLTEV